MEERFKALLTGLGFNHIDELLENTDCGEDWFCEIGKVIADSAARGSSICELSKKEQYAQIVFEIYSLGAAKGELNIPSWADKCWEVGYSKCVPED